MVLLFFLFCTAVDDVTRNDHHHEENGRKDQDLEVEVRGVDSGRSGELLQVEVVEGEDPCLRIRPRCRSSSGRSGP